MKTKETITHYMVVAYHVMDQRPDTYGPFPTLNEVAACVATLAGQYDAYGYYPIGLTTVEPSSPG